MDNNFDFSRFNLIGKKYLFATLHRRENWGKPIVEIANAFKRILDRNKNSCVEVFDLQKHITTER